MNLLKLILLYITRIFRCIFKHIGINISILLVVFSTFVSIFFLIPSLFSRVPVFSYFIDTLSLPLSYELEGTVILLDSNDEIIDESVTIYVGGYSIEAISGETFLLNFSSEPTEQIYATIEYADEAGIKTILTKKIETKDRTKLKKVIRIYV